MSFKREDSALPVSQRYWLVCGIVRMILAADGRGPRRGPRDQGATLSRYLALCYPTEGIRLRVPSKVPDFQNGCIVPDDGGVGRSLTGLKQRFGESRVDLMAYGRTQWS